MTTTSDDEEKEQSHTRLNENVRMSRQQQQQQQQQQVNGVSSSSSSSILFHTEPFFPLASQKYHIHDAFGPGGGGDEGVDYGPPNPYDDDDDDDGNDDDGNNETESSEKNHLRSNNNNLPVTTRQQTRMTTTIVGGGQEAVATAEAVGNTDQDTSLSTNITIEEIEEEIYMRETTLQSLVTKLTSLTNEINNEENNISKQKVQLCNLTSRYNVLTKRTCENKRIENIINRTLIKCNERYIRALNTVGGAGIHDAATTTTTSATTTDEDAHNNAMDYNDDDGDDDDDIDNLMMIDERVEDDNDDKDAHYPTPSLANINDTTKDRTQQKEDDSIDLIVEQTPNNAISTTEHRTPIIREEEYICIDIPLDNYEMYDVVNDVDEREEKEIVEEEELSLSPMLQQKHHQRQHTNNNNNNIGKGNISWPDTSLVTQIQNNVQTLSQQHQCIFPKYRTSSLSSSSSILGGMDNAHLIEHVINVAVLEKCLLVVNEENHRDNLGRVGVGWINEVDIWGTILDVYTHVEWTHLFTCLQRSSVGTGEEGGIVDGMMMDSSSSSTIDPNIIICPHELSGTCTVDQCPYQHIQDTRRYTRTKKRSKTTTKSSRHDKNQILVAIPPTNVRREGYMRYINLPKPKLPRLFTKDDFIIDETRMNDNATMNDDITTNNLTLPTTLSRDQDKFDTQAWNDSDVDHRSSLDDNNNSVVGELKQKTDIQDNLDFVSLPPATTVANDDETESGDESVIVIGNKTYLFHNVFWWQQMMGPLSKLLGLRDQPCSCFDNILYTFGFERLCTIENNGKRSYTLRYITRLISIDDASTTAGRMEDILLISRLIDSSRVLVHMGQYSFALSALHSICQSKSDRDYYVLVHGASCSIRSLSLTSSCFHLFQVQLHLLTVSEILRCAYFDSRNRRLCLKTLSNNVDQLNLTVSDDDLDATFSSWESKFNLFPPGINMILKNLISRIPSSTPYEDGCDDEWAPFVKTLRLSIEKFVVVPFIHLKMEEQLNFLLQSIAIGKLWGRVIQIAAAGNQFLPYLHVLEPIWSSLQKILRVSHRCTQWLRPEIVATVMIGPVIFGCVADMIAPMGMCSSSSKSPPKFDTRSLANLSFLDTFIVGILRELNRNGKCNGGGIIEVLIGPLHALSASICVALGSTEKAHTRLEHFLNKERGVGDCEAPSMYALSEMMWSQYVQLRMLCPSTSSPLNYVGDSAGSLLSVPKLSDDILRCHQHVASRIAGNCIVLWGVKLRGDCHMNIVSPSMNGNHRRAWVKMASQIFTGQGLPVIYAKHDKTNQNPPLREFTIWNPYHDLNGIEVILPVFPDSLLLLTTTLARLTLNKCGITMLPLSIGYHLTNLQVLNLSDNDLSELPTSICNMKKLMTLTVSNNQLRSFPDGLSQCNSLRTLDASHNQLRTFPDVLIRCSSLCILDLSRNQLMTYPADLALHLSKLTSFLVHGNPLDVLHQQKSASHEPKTRCRSRTDSTANSENGDGMKDVKAPIKSNPAALSILHQSSELAIHQQSTTVGRSKSRTDSTANLNISNFISEPREATTSIRGADFNPTLLKKSTSKVNPFVAQAEAKLAAEEAAEASSLVVTTIGKNGRCDVIDLTSSSAEMDAKKLKRMKNKEKKKQNKEKRKMNKKKRKELKSKEKVASILDQPGSDAQESDDIGELCDSDLDVVSSANVTVTNGHRELRDRPV